MLPDPPVRVVSGPVGGQLAAAAAAVDDSQLPALAQNRLKHMEAFLASQTAGSGLACGRISVRKLGDFMNATEK